MKPGETVQGFRLSPQQERLWALQAEGHCPLSQCALLLNGPLDSDALVVALQSLVERHEIFRTTFQSLPGMTLPVQIVNDGLNQDCRRVDVVHHENAIEQLCEEDRGAQFNLASDRPLRATIGVFSTNEAVLVLTVPSLCADARTLKNVALELPRLYAAVIDGRKVDETVWQYADYAEFQQQLGEAPEAREGRSYWLERANTVTKASLPPRIETSPRAVAQLKTIRMSLSADLLQRIRLLAADHEVSLPVFLLACWETLLGLTTGQNRFVVGRMCEGRSYEELSGAMGRFCRQVPTLCNIEPELRFDDVLRHVAQATGEDERWLDYYDAELFQTPFSWGFEFLSSPETQLAAGVKFSISNLTSEGERFEVNLSCIENTDDLTLALSYDQSRFSLSNITRLARQLQVLINDVTLHTHVRAGELQLMDQAERHQLLIEWNDTQAEYESRTSITALIERGASLRPDAVALVYENEQLTYSQLNAISNQIARHLQSLGIGPETRVGLLLERSPLFILGMMGVLKAGGVAVPFDPAYPKDRIAFMLNDAGTFAVLSQSSLVELLPPDLKTICLDVEWPAILRLSSEPLEKSSSGENLAYVVYTSGSTGAPKGVAVCHRSLANYVKTMSERLGLTNEDTYLHTASVSFSASARQIFVPFSCGARLVLATSLERKDPLALSNIFQWAGVTVWDTVPSFLASVFEALETLDKSAYRFERAPRLIVVTGEILPLDVIERWLERLPSTARVVNLYGQSETTGTVILEPFRALPERKPLSAPIGRPLSNTEVFLLNPLFQPVPVSAVGELYLSGASHCRAYLDAALTAERFVPNPFGDEPGQRLYKTGDLASYLPDGRLEFISRGDDQVQIRGMRVQLKEVEWALSQHQDVQRAVVVAREDAGGDRRLFAYVTAQPGSTPEVAELREFLLQRLPDYMIPAAVVLLDAWPLTPTGKLDRQALPLPGHDRPELRAAYVAPRTPLESVIAEVWAEVLDLEQVGVNDDFFDLGGHSMLITQILVRLRDLLRVELQVPLFFDSPTVAQLGAVILENSPEPARIEKTAELVLALSETPAVAGEQIAETHP
ncbi:MAG TPA: amino acid adenylation domain-containing protein [Pyrinomonadaceae bacterium]